MFPVWNIFANAIRTTGLIFLISGSPNMPELPQSRAWQPTTLVKATAGLHAVAFASLLVPGAWPWSLGALAMNHALVASAGLLPRCQWLGQNLTHLPRSEAVVAITIDDGPNPDVTPAVLDILEAKQACATFFCIGSQVQRHPALAREILSRGHAIGNHTQNHRHHFSLMSPAQITREIDQAQSAIEDATGFCPHYFRAPAGLRNIFLDPVLYKLGLELASWTRRGFDTRVANPTRVSRSLIRHLLPGDILLLHDHHAAIAASGKPVVLEVLPGLLDTIEAAGYRTVRLAKAVT
jgi:peptidoglycan-N-acetylglucosamine deacetylase